MKTPLVTMFYTSYVNGSLSSCLGMYFAFILFFHCIWEGATSEEVYPCQHVLLVQLYLD